PVCSIGIGTRAGTFASLTYRLCHTSAMSDEAVAGSGAYDDRARREMRRYRRWAWGWLLGGLAVFIGFVFAVMTVYQRAGDLERTGVRVPGIVSNIRALGENGSIVVDFEWKG